MGVQSHTACCSAQHWKIVQWQDCWHTSMATCSLPGAARHPQPCHAQLPSLPGSLAVVWRCVDSSDPAASTSTACRSAASRRQAWTLAACRRFGQLVAETSPDGHHTAAGRILPRQVTVRAANAGSAHRSESYFSSQEPEAGCLSAQTFGSELGCSATGSPQATAVSSAQTLRVSSSTPTR